MSACMCAARAATAAPRPLLPQFQFKILFSLSSPVTPSTQQAGRVVCSGTRPQHSHAISNDVIPRIRGPLQSAPRLRGQAPPRKEEWCWVGVMIAGACRLGRCRSVGCMRSLTGPSELGSTSKTTGPAAHTLRDSGPRGAQRASKRARRLQLAPPVAQHGHRSQRRHWRPSHPLPPPPCLI